MSDVIDQANDRAERELERSIAVHRRTPEIEATGACLYCEEPVAKGMRWCDSDCRDGFDKEAAQRQRQGRA